MSENRAFMLVYVRNHFLQIFFGVLAQYLILGFLSSSVNVQVHFFFIFFFSVYINLNAGGICSNLEAAASILLISSLQFYLFI